MTDLQNSLGFVYRKDLANLERLKKDQVNQTDDDGRTPLMHAILAEDADASVVRILLARGANVNVNDGGQHWTPLHFAARDGNQEIVQLLLDAGALVDAQNLFGNTSLWEQIIGPKKSLPTIEKLLAHGADPNQKNKNGVSPIDLARADNRHDILRTLER